jgi:ComF family protein
MRDHPETNVNEITSITAHAAHAWHGLGKVCTDLLFPPACSFCLAGLLSEHRFGLCNSCLSELTVDKSAEYCRKCGTLSLEGVFGLSKCPECDKRNYRFDETLPIGIFRGELRHALIRAKNFAEFPLARSIGQLVGNRVKSFITDNPPDLAVSIPKYWLKRMLQGSNSSELIAAEVAKTLHIPFYPHALRWIRRIRKQSLLSVTERTRNVRGALKLARGFTIDGTHILVVDDTMTTGATANEAAAVLKKAGAERVTVAVAARASNLDTLDEIDLRPTDFAKVG